MKEAMPTNSGEQGQLPLEGFGEPAVPDFVDKPHETPTEDLVPQAVADSLPTPPVTPVETVAQPILKYPEVKPDEYGYYGYNIRPGLTYKGKLITDSNYRDIKRDAEADDRRLDAENRRQRTQQTG